jgi:hypothetical protein
MWIRHVLLECLVCSGLSNSQVNLQADKLLAAMELRLAEQEADQHAVVDTFIDIIRNHLRSIRGESEAKDVDGVKKVAQCDMSAY